MSGTAQQEITGGSQANDRGNEGGVPKTTFDPFALWAGGLEAFCRSDNEHAERRSHSDRHEGRQDNQGAEGVGI